jgi:predicted enzyme related to lactoylglutathione lyase
MPFERTGFRQPGEFCWRNTLTPEPAQARAFFSELLGWTYADAGMGQAHGASASGWACNRRLPRSRRVALVLAHSIEEYVGHF